MKVRKDAWTWLVPMKLYLPFVLTAAAIVALPSGIPHPVEYVADPGLPVGGFLFIVDVDASPDANGQSQLTIMNDVTNPVGAVYCQDLNGNSICGERDPLAPAGVFSEPRVVFCATMTLDSPVSVGSKTPAQWAAGENWDTTKPVLVRVMLMSDICGSGSLGAVKGVILHSP